MNAAAVVAVLAGAVDPMTAADVAERLGVAGADARRAVLAALFRLVIAGTVRADRTLFRLAVGREA